MKNTLMLLCLVCSPGWATDAAYRAPIDFAYGQALFQHHTGRDFAALVTLQTSRVRQAGAGEAASRVWLRTDLLSRFGLFDDAAQLLGTLDSTAPTPTTRRAWLALARSAHRQGALAEVEPLLAGLLDAGAVAALEQLALSQLSQGDGRAALHTLQQAPARSLSAYAQYNLALSHWQQDGKHQAQEILERLGRLPAANSYSPALRDRCNLSLAYLLLAQGQAAAARTALGRIRLQGMHAEAALLALGWAELHGPPEIRDPVPLAAGNADAAPGTLALFQQENRGAAAFAPVFDPQTPQSARQTQIRRALGPWLALHQRDLKHAPVQEVHLAIPYVLNALGERETARRYYQLAITRLEVADRQLLEAISQVQSGSLIEALIQAQSAAPRPTAAAAIRLPDGPAVDYLARLIAGHPFQTLLGNERDLRQIDHESALWLARAQAWSCPYERNCRSSAALAPSGAPLHLQLSQNLHPAPERGWRRTEQLISQLATPRSDLHLATTLPLFDPGQPAPLEQARAQLTALQARLRQTQDKLRERMSELSLDELRRQQARLRRHLSEARFGLARSFDPGQSQP